MAQYKVTFKKGEKKREIKVNAQGLVPAIEAAIRKHFSAYVNSLGFEIIAAEKISE